MPTKTKKVTNHKRHGAHHRHSKQYKKVYWPYLPLVVSVALSLFVSYIAPRTSTLAYATSMSQQGLLDATNSHRANNGQTALSLNSKLNSAAQAKANDMVARNYWSHTTPDGQEPWVFISNAGYSYLKAGENLAYGFLTSADTVIGWMNSPSHKANMLDSAYLEVGFGFANSENFNNSGNQTVVVAMYGKPQTLGATQQTPAPTQAAPAPTPVAQAQPAPVPAPATPAEQAKPEEIKEETKPKENPVNTATGMTVANTKPINRVQTLTEGNAPWATLAIGVLTGTLATTYALKHAIALKRFIKDGERFILHHPLFDSTVIGLAILSFTLLQTTGFII